MFRSRRTYLLLMIAGMAGCTALGDYSSDDPGFVEVSGEFDGRFLAISDADMTATAYVDGKLEPIAGALDELTLFADGAPISRAPAPNSVIGWPQVVDVSSDGKFAYVIETRGSLPPGTDQVDSVTGSFPFGQSLHAYAIEGSELSHIGTLDGIGIKPKSVEVSSNGKFLVISTEADDAELIIVPLQEDGRPGEPVIFDLDPPYQPSDLEKNLTTAHLSPNSRTLAVNVGTLRLQFYELETGTDGIPVAAVPINDPIDVGVRMSVGRWTLDGKFFIVTDVNAYESNLAMLTQRGGQIHVVKPPTKDKPAALIDSARVGRFAEGLELSDDGRLIASIAMERTYLPELFFLENWPKRRRYTLALLSLDPDTGALTKLDEIQAAGVLPEDVIFDKSGKNLAVAVFHRRKGADRQRGFIDFFSISDDLKLVAQKRTQPVVRGAHDLVRLPE